MDQEKKGCSLVKMKSNWEEKGFVSFISLLVLQHAQKSFLKFFLSICYEKKIRFCFVLLFIIIFFLVKHAYYLFSTGSNTRCIQRLWLEKASETACLCLIKALL